jgi:uncharacterized protein YjlB
LDAARVRLAKDADNKHMAQIEHHLLQDDGTVPNNPRLPLILYRQVLVPGDTHRIEQLFAANGWSNAWVNGIYPFHHYHATTHEVLGIASGSARVQFGGPSGPIVDVSAGDAVMIPAGVGHCRLSHDAGLIVVGAYPGGSDWDLRRANPADYSTGQPLVAKVADPVSDPILGADGPACRAASSA